MFLFHLAKVKSLNYLVERTFYVFLGTFCPEEPLKSRFSTDKWKRTEENFTLTFNVPLVHTAPDVMILMRANPLQGPLEGVGPEIETFLALTWERAKRVPFGPNTKSRSSPPSWWRKINYKGLFGNHSSQLPRLIEKLPQWLSGPSPVLPAADYQTGSK